MWPLNFQYSAVYLEISIMLALSGRFFSLIKLFVSEMFLASLPLGLIENQYDSIQSLVWKVSNSFSLLKILEKGEIKVF